MKDKIFVGDQRRDRYTHTPSQQGNPMKIQYIIPTLLLILTVSHPCRAGDTPQAALDTFHRAMADAETKALISTLSPDAVLLGLDGNTRWAGENLGELIGQRFSRVPDVDVSVRQREVRLSPDGGTAWFDESLLYDGIMQGWGSGVLVKIDTDWKIAQYHLSPPLWSASSSAPPAATTANSGVGEAGATTVQGAATTNAIPPTAAPTTEAAATEPEKKACRRMRHKTNKVSSC
jgi:hypothetical protein